MKYQWAELHQTWRRYALLLSGRDQPTGVNFAAFIALLKVLLKSMLRSTHCLVVRRKGRAKELSNPSFNFRKVSFNKVKSLLTSALLLGYPDFKRLFIMEDDPSHLGLGAVLSSEQDTGRVVLGYASLGLHGSE